MRRRRIRMIAALLVAGVVPVVGAAEKQGQSSGGSQSVPTQLSGTITALDLDGLSPSLELTDSSKKSSTVVMDRYSTTVRSSNGPAELSDLQVGQQAQVTVKYEPYVGVTRATSITITPQAKAAAPTASTSAPSATAAASATSRSAPRALRSDRDGHDAASSSTNPSASSTASH
ncbi:MAG: hypothetical protein HYZ89_03745 [Candidatus Omnitrophica bacterium]|nr:hypothetical protein [Candidatus Omnitrophota bacterium]